MRTCWLGCLYGLAVALGSCTVEQVGGESGVGACTDGTDNDDDHAIDCDDPDCQAEAVCGRAARLSEPDGGGVSAHPMMPPVKPPVLAKDAGAMTPAPPEQLGDAGAVPQPPNETPPDPENPPDAATTPECPACAADESCIKGYCVPNEAVFVELWNVTHISTVFPRIFAKGGCIDPECIPLQSGTTEFPFCFCLPDPLVRVLVTRPGELAEPVAESPFDLLTSMDHDEAEWDIDQQIALRPEYEITLQAIDRDGPAEDVIFECTMAADADLLGSGTLSCNQTFTGTSGKPFMASIAVTIVPSPTGAM
jgi:hypothetical protein